MPLDGDPDIDDAWVPSCQGTGGKLWQFTTEGGPEAHGVAYCMYCGKPVKTARKGWEREVLK